MEISFTKLRLFLECPLKYKLRLIDGKRSPLPPAASLGISLHRALECFHRKEAPGPEDLAACYESRWLASGYPDDSTRDKWFAKGRRILDRYVKRDTDRRSQIVSVEREFVYPLGRHEVRGMVDRIDRHPDGRIEVIDYKTVGDGEVLEPMDELQLRFYGLGLRESLAMPAALLSVDLLAAGRRITVPYDPAGEAGLKSMIAETADRIEAGAFAPIMSFCPNCEFCETCTRSAA
ncbi:MAG: PD-(D/E)XK nuclease family protein [Elusimicrobiota bacterium]|jgi:RecB family exonuclease